MKSPMFIRHRKLISCLDQGQTEVEQLSRLLGVSTMTIRRDLIYLAKQGKVLRTYGGAVVRERLKCEYSQREKASRNKLAKELVGRIASHLVHPHEMVYIDTGTTALAVAQALRGKKPCTVVTTNLAAAQSLVEQPDIRVLVAGGELSSHSPEVRGEWTLYCLSAIRVDVAFLGCDAVDPSAGYYSADEKSAALSQLMLSRSRRRYLVTDSSKFGASSFFRIAPLSSLSGIVTDNLLEEHYRHEVGELGLLLYQCVQDTKFPAKKYNLKKKEKTANEKIIFDDRVDLSHLSGLRAGE